MKMPTTPLATALLARITVSFEAARDPARAAPMRAYMREQFAFLGIDATRRVALARAALVGLPKPGVADLEAVALAAWERPEREYQYFAQWYLRRFARLLPASFIGTARHLIVTRPWWDTVDELANHVVGPLVRATPGLSRVMDEWIEDEDLWLARTALLHQNRYREATDPERLFRYCQLRAGDTDFFIRKAIGWSLREYGKTDPGAVRRFVEDHQAALSGLSKREALKLPDPRPSAPPPGAAAKGKPARRSAR